MAVFRIEKTQNYTVMSNHHLRNKILSLKAKGLLSQMLSLPENWDYTLKGLSQINRESVEAIRTAVLELETAGYITRRQTRDPKGKMSSTEYTIYELPQDTPTSEQQNSPLCDFPITDKPFTGNPLSDCPTSENATQLNKESKAITEKTITDLSNTHQSIYPASSTTPEQQPPSGGIDRIDRQSAIDIYRDIIADNIEYDHLCTTYDKERATEILELILETVCTSRKTIRIGGEEFPAEVVKSRFMKIEQFHVEYVFDCIDKNTTKIHNIKAYLLTTLYNAPLTMGHYYTAAVNHDFYGGGRK